MVAKTARKKAARGKKRVRLVSGEKFWTPERRRAHFDSIGPVKGEREFFKFMDAEIAAHGR